MTTERNWLIRTTQKQILGPVAKAKVIEFLQKGALGLNDEVTSGNGYWFSLKEKDLVDKFLYGDVPQGYNPISESKSVLSKRENPDKTTSLNTAPANKTQVLKVEADGPVVLPKNEDLEYPDITLVSAVPPLSSAAVPAVSHDEVKLPNQDDLEFPDITIVARPSAPSDEGHDGLQVHTEAPRPMEVKTRPPEKMESKTEEGPVAYPKDDDLEFPDMGGPSALKETVEEELDFQVNIPEAAPKAVPVPAPAPEAKPAAKKPGIMDFKYDSSPDENLTLMMDMKEHVAPAKTEVKAPKPEKVETLKLEKKASPAQHHQPEKLLHERKIKTSSQPKEITKDLPKEVQERAMPEHLKKRNDNYLLYLLVIIVLIILGLFFYYYRNILNKPLPV